jgi:hypothetical protein
MIITSVFSGRRVTNSEPFIELGSSLLYAQNLSTGSYPEPAESNPVFTPYICHNYFSTIILSPSSSTGGLFPSVFHLVCVHF